MKTPLCHLTGEQRRLQVVLLVQLQVPRPVVRHKGCVVFKSVKVKGRVCQTC